MTSTPVTLPGYHFNEKIHSSSRTVVYRGRDIANGQPVVIKLMRHEYPSFSEIIKFRNQYAIAKNLEIEGIIKTYALERYENRYALIMEDMGGVSLAEYPDKSSLSLPQFLALAIQLADILHQLHNNSIIHKDIKPANILIHPGTKKINLIDFSISSVLPKETQTIQTPNILEGTLAYLSPEQTGRMNRGIDYRSDFYSLGVTFYELLTGILPFKKEDPLELIHAHIAERPKAIGDICPQPLSDIVLKLMAKNAEDRYQSALGLKYDLEKCLTQYQENGEIELFTLGERDICSRFNIPEKLYGREEEVNTLLDAFERVATGQSEMMLVAGFSGIGKTAVVNEVHKPIVKNRGYFIKGKFDQFNRNIPLYSFVQAFRSLMGQILSESDAQLTDWKTQILEAVGTNGQVLVDVIPELELVIGQQPPVPELSGSAAQNRFNLLFEKFITVFTTPEHPLVMFLDDLQWADSASLNLMKVLMGDSERGYLLLLGAYRDNEVFPAHPLMLTLGELAKQEAALSTITLAPLSVHHINQLVAETLSCHVEQAQTVTEFLYQKTQGNPFFTTQFLVVLYEDELIVFNAYLGYWECDLVQVRDAALTDDVVEFMALRLQKLPAETQEVLKLAACIGNQFDLETLAIVREASSEEVAAEIWSALQEGTILPISEAYKFFQGAIDSAKPETVVVNYRFLHDRVQQAAYALIPDQEKASAHYQLGQLLLKQASQEEIHERIFEIVNNLNYGIDAIANQTECLQIASLNLRAARKAKQSIAYGAAVEYLNVGIQLLKEESWDNEYQLSFDLHKECSETEYLKGNLERSEILAFQTLERARSVIDRAEIYNILIIQHTVTAKYQESIDEGKIALNLLGIQWNEENLSQEMDEEFQLAKKLLGNREISSLIEIPEMEIPEKRSAIKLLHNLLPSAFSINQPLWSVLVVKMVNLSLQYGHISECCFGYSFYGVLLSSMFGDHEAGYEFGVLSVKLSHKFKDLAQQTKASNILAAFLIHWKKPIKYCEQFNREGYLSGLESGQFQFVGYITYNRILSRFHSGRILSEVLADFPMYLPVLDKIQHYYSYDITIGCQYAISDLVYPQLSDIDATSQENQEKRYLENCYSRDSFPAICIYKILRGQSLYFFEQSQQALEYLVSAQEFLHCISGHFIIAEHIYYQSLVRLNLYREVPEKEKSQIVEPVKKNKEQLTKWSRNCPQNFQHKLALVEAEVARNHQNKVQAIELYDRAIAGAKENEYIQDEALANELFAKFYLDWGREKEASVYMQDAYYCYAGWGAKAKTDHLEEHYPELLKPILQKERQSFSSGTSISKITSTSHSQTATVANISSILDFSSLLKASQALSGEIELDRLLSKILKIILENAGATKGALLLTSKQGLTVEAIATRNNDELQFDSIHQSIPLDDYPDLPTGLINYVRRTTETALLDAETAQTQFPAERYLLRFSPQSLLCLPLLERGNLIGILYLENTLIADAFTSDRIELLDALCAQAAISLENARLYNNLEIKVQERTAELSQALQDLKNTQKQLVESEKMAALGGLVAGVAHEINTPVGTSITLASTLNDETQEFAKAIASGQLKRSLLNNYVETSQECSQLIVDNLQRAGELVSSFKQVAVDQTNLEIRTFYLKAYLSEILTSLMPNIRQGGHQLKIEGDESIQVKTYPGALAQIVTNLINNSLSHGYPDGHSGQLTWRVGKEAEKIVIEYSDDGCGIPEADLEKIFEPFYTTARNQGGTGLGLHIVYNTIAQKLKGKIAVSSQLGRGVQFKLSLPDVPA